MSEAKTINVSSVKFTSTVFPTGDDMRLWESLSAPERRAVILRDVEEGLRGPKARNAGKDEIMAEALAELTHAL